MTRIRWGAKLASIMLVLFVIDIFLLFLWRQANPNSFLADQILCIAIVTASAFTLFLITRKTMGAESGRSPVKGFWLQLINEPAVVVLLLISFVSSTVLVQTQTLLNIDRSRSYFILEWIECSPSKELLLVQNKITSVFGAGEIGAFNLRLVEQETRGFIAREGDTVNLTRLGSILFRFSEISAGVFKLSGWETNKIWNDSNC